MRIKIIHLFILFICLTFFLTNIFSQKTNAKVAICYIKKLKEDSVLVNIKNQSLSDTLHFSIYKQELVNDRFIMTNVYDIFVDMENPRTTNLILYPNHNLTFNIKVPPLVFPEEIIEEKEWSVQSIKYRFMLKVNINTFKGKEIRVYSNYIDG